MINCQTLLDMKILIIDDEPLNVTLLEEMLRDSGYANLCSTTDARLALPLYCSFQPDLILLDLMMPYLDGFQVMRQLERAIPASAYLPILVLTADATLETKRKALDVGARDFLTKPFDDTEVLLRIRNLLQTRPLHLQLENQNQILDQRVCERTRELQQAQTEVIKSMELWNEAQGEILQRLAQAAEYRDDDTGQHTVRVGHMAGLIARELGLPDTQVDLIRRAAPLHDVGKIGISDSILLKPERLTADEFNIMKMHTTIGANILSGGHSELIEAAEHIALNHHERWDGMGYPYGLQGEGIPIPSQIVSVADVFDALTHERPYKKPWTVAQAVDEILSQRAKQFNPRVVDAFMNLRHAELV